MSLIGLWASQLCSIGLNRNPVTNWEEDKPDQIYPLLANDTHHTHPESDFSSVPPPNKNNRSSQSSETFVTTIQDCRGWAFNSLMSKINNKIPNFTNLFL